MSRTERADLSAKPAGRADAALDDMTAKGAAVMRDAKAGLDGMVADATNKGQAALRSARDVRDTFADAILGSVKSHPYTTLAIAGALGFIYGATRRR